LNIFIQGYSMSINELKQQAYFLEMLETMVPGDAEILLGMKNHKMPDRYKNITKSLVMAAFPKETKHW